MIDEPYIPRPDSPRKKWNLWRKKQKKLSEEISVPPPRDTCEAIEELKNAPPYVPPPEKDTRVQREIARTLAKVLGEQDSWRTPLPRRNIGLEFPGEGEDKNKKERLYP